MKFMWRMLVTGLLGTLLPIHLASAQQELTVVSWGGSYVKSQILGFIRPYEDQTGTRVEVMQYAGGLDDIRSQVRAWNIHWDVVDLELFDAIKACEEGLLETIDHSTLPPAPDGTPAAQDFIDNTLVPCGVGNVVGSTVVSYRKDALPEAPQKLEDFFDLDKFPGRRGLRRSPQVNLEWALLADGVEPEKVYDVLSTEQGLTRAFRKLDKIKPHVDWWRNGEEAVNLLAREQVAMSAVYSGRIEDAVERGQPLEILWDHQVWFFDVWGIPKNGRNTELAMDFIRHATSTESLAAQAEHIPYGPVRQSSMALLDPQQRSRLPTAEQNLATSLELNAAWWADNIERIRPRFERWVERPVMVPKALPR